jgi:hypothetical protein
MHIHAGCNRAAAKLIATPRWAIERARLMSQEHVQMSDAPWWRGAVTYQIYRGSFLDTVGDGVGDLPGMMERLD